MPNKKFDSKAKRNYLFSIYTRSATGDKASLEGQEMRCRTAVRQAGWTIVDAYVRCDARASGNSFSKREGLESLIAAAKIIAAAKMTPRPFDHIVVDEPSRLTRDLRQAIELIDVLAQYKVKVYYVDELVPKNKGLRLKLALDKRQYKGMTNPIG